jgi:putative holliday junction resolvase
MRILAVDPGEKRIGLAISDPTATIASPLMVIKHVSRLADAAAIAAVASDNEASLIIIGAAFDDEGEHTTQSRRALRLAEAVRSQTSLLVELWDESGSTQHARAARIAMGVSHKKRRGHMDDLAAAVILQSYLDSRL